MMKRTNIVYLILLLSVTSAIAQGSKSLADAERFFGVRSYDMALAKFLEAIQAGEKDPMVHYKTAVCYQKSPETDEQIKSISYFEYALRNGKKLPVTHYYDLRAMYLKEENIQKALENFIKFKDVNSKADKK